MRTIILDANVLILFLAGNADRKLLGTAVGLKEFEFADLELVNEFAFSTVRHVSLPNVLTETSNMLRQIKGFQKSGALIRKYCETLDEVHEPSKNVAEHVHFDLLGLTDAAILMASLVQRTAGHEVVVLTRDKDLHGKLVSQKIEAINPDHYKTPKRK